MNAVQRKYRNLLRLAKDQAGHPEGAVASDIAGRMREKYGDDLGGLRDDDLEIRTGEIRFAEQWESDLIIAIAYWLGYTPTQRRAGGRGPWRKAIYIDAPSAIVDQWIETFRSHRGRLERIQNITVWGYLCGAFPRETEGAEGGGMDLSAEESAVLLKAALMGRRNAATREIPESAGGE